MDGSLHTLKVSIVLDPHHYDLDARRSYTAPKRLDDPLEAAKQEIIDAIFELGALLPLVICAVGRTVNQTCKPMWRT